MRGALTFSPGVAHAVQNVHRSPAIIDERLIWRAQSTAILVGSEMASMFHPRQAFFASTRTRLAAQEEIMTNEPLRALVPLNLSSAWSPDVFKQKQQRTVASISAQACNPPSVKSPARGQFFGI